MNIDLEYDILFNQQQKKRKYDINNSNARTRKSTAEKEDQHFYMLQFISPVEDFEAHFSCNEVENAEVVEVNKNVFIESSTQDFSNLPLNENVQIQPGDLVEERLFSDSSDLDNESQMAESDSEISSVDFLSSGETSRPLHQFTTTTTKFYCADLLKLLRQANVCKSHSKRFISLIQSALPIPNNFPSTFEEILSLLNVEDLFFRRTICLKCKIELNFNRKKCSNCELTSDALTADVYDIDLNKVLKRMLKRLSRDIEEYKDKIINSIDQHETNDIPFGTLYKKLRTKYGLENIISLLLHVDGISLTRSTRLKMWLFSGALVELPPLLRYRRHNMLLLSVWISTVEPDPDIWLKSIIEEINQIKMQDIRINEGIAYKLKIYGVTGDCPALRLILKFIGHGGYFCCWYCYIKGQHIDGKRQYKYQHQMMLRDSITYLEESTQAIEWNTNVLGHLGVTVLQPVLDLPLPNSIIADYLHVSLLGHAKAIIMDLYRSMKPSERIELDAKLCSQKFPHHFNRKMRKIEKFAYVKGTEVKNILLYGLLPCFQSYLPLEKLSHIALYVCFIRLLHGKPIFGSDTVGIANQLFQEYYMNHDDYYSGLQNLVLHLHVHLTTIYENHGSLANIGCFGQEDFIGDIASNHHGTRHHGELITFYYNIDFALRPESSSVTSIDSKGYDLVVDSFDQYGYVHEESCDCHMAHYCLNIYRRFLIKQTMYHSLTYNKRGHSVSYFVQFFFKETSPRFGIIEFFFILQNKSKSYACIWEHAVKQNYSSYFETSKFFDTLKKPLDTFFFVLEDNPTKRSFIRTDFIKNHCIVFQMNDCKVVTPVSTYNEHD